jgi:acyl-CoA hydrolase
LSQVYQSATELADSLIRSLGKKIVLGLPIGIGKAVHVVDALFERAISDPSISLTIFTGLTLSAPRVGAGLESRLVGPIVERLYADWPTPAYVQAVSENSIPSNIKIREFYLRPGAYLGNDFAQQNYVSINYSQVVAELLELGVNTVVQLVASRADSPGKYSLSSNPEITLDLLPQLEARGRLGQAVAMVGQVNSNLPYMFGDAELDANRFDFILDSDELQFPLFGLPNRRVTPADYATGMHVASLIPDGGTLQLGIGSLSDAVAHCLSLRHDSPEVFTGVLDRLPGGTGSTRRPSLPVEKAPFEKGLYASTELLSDAIFALFERGLIKRPADEDDETLIHAGFFVGSRALYEAINKLPPEQRKLINMTGISFVNTLFGDEQRKRRQRRDARFVNETMMATLLGAAVSDALDDGQVVSGVGGQFDFVSMAHSLQNAQSVLMLRASRSSRGALQSNIRWSYGHTTVPRHHRDIYVSEYGIAATRGRTDMQVIESMLQIADSAFQAELIEQSKRARKLAADYRLPDDAANNSSQAILDIFDDPGLQPYFPEYPLGTDLTVVEQELARAMEWLQSNMTRTSSKLGVLLKSIVSQDLPKQNAALDRLGLGRPSTINSRLQRRLVNFALHRTKQ